MSRATTPAPRVTARTPRSTAVISRDGTQPSRSIALALVGCLLLAGLAGVIPAAEATPGVDQTPAAADSGPTAPADPGADDGERPRIVAVYPNPVTHMDAGEYVEVWLPPDSDRYQVIAGRTTVTLAANRSGRVVLTNDPAAVRVDGDPHVIGASQFALANSGGQLRLTDADGNLQHAVTYDQAPEGKRWATAEQEWLPRGYQPREPKTDRDAAATVFTLPDSPSIPRSTLRNADQRILLAGYTLTSDAVVRALRAARERGVTVRVLLEGDPIGGIDRRQARALDRLVQAGVDVRVLSGPRSRFGYHHAKYAVVDDEALVLTENWKPAGTGGRGSRGWGVKVTESTVSGELAALYERDAGAADATEWSQYRRGKTFEQAAPATGEYPSEIDPKSVRVARVRLLTAPGNAEGEMVQAIDDAESSVAVLQPTIERESALVRASIRAASRGVEVRILLSNAWYVAEENNEHVAALNEYADRREIPLSARVATPRGQYEKIHAKGLVVDEQVAYVGSLNWNSQAAERNREVVLELDGDAAGAYFAAAFEADWKRSQDRLPLGVAIAALATAGLAAVLARRRISFGDGKPVAPPSEQTADLDDGVAGNRPENERTGSQ